MSVRGWHREPARHALASRGIKTRSFNKITFTGRSVPIEQYGPFKRASVRAHSLGHNIGSKGIPDDHAGSQGSEQMWADIRKVVGRQQHAIDVDSEWDHVSSYLWDDFWRGWREGYHEYMEREWD